MGAVEKARSMIEEIVQGVENAFVSAPFIEVPKSEIPRLIGEKGAYVLQLQTSLGVKIDIPDADTDPCKVYLRGSEENVEYAKQFLVGSVENLSMPEEAVGIILGRNGTRIRELQEASGARIDLERKQGKCWVRVSGTAQQIDDGIQEIFTV